MKWPLLLRGHDFPRVSSVEHQPSPNDSHPSMLWDVHYSTVLVLSSFRKCVPLITLTSWIWYFSTMPFCLHPYANTLPSLCILDLSNDDWETGHIHFRVMPTHGYFPHNAYSRRVSIAIFSLTLHLALLFPLWILRLSFYPRYLLLSLCNILCHGFMFF